MQGCPFSGAAGQSSLWAGSPEREQLPDRDGPERQGGPAAPMRCWGPAIWGLMADSHSGGGGIRLERGHIEA